ncbi:MAG: BrnT family toxin [Gammaproteobacteria bacterium]|jgi:uncharacterized DUF497 family protein
MDYLLQDINGFDWDSGNTEKIISKHDVSPIEAEQIFFNDPLLLMDDIKHSESESRYHALGITNDSRLLHITFTLRSEGSLIRVISARSMHRKERKVYEQAQKNT